jgi:peroxiredoxin Q/BCP
MTRLETGQKAPAFTLKDHAGKPHKLSDFAGKRVIVYFYPAALTPGCTKQACDFRDNIKSLKSAGYTVIGISPDSPEKLAEFVDAEELNFLLLSDPDHKVMEKYGAWGEKNLYGKIVTGVIRSTFVLDETQKIQRAMYGVKATGHVAKLRKDLGIS